jgi:hypothetical protein
MDMGLLVALGGVAAVLLVVVFSGGRRTHRALAAARADVELLRARLDEIESSGAAAPTPPVVPRAEYLITTAGTGEATEPAPQVPNRAVLSVTFGEPLVKVVAFGYGVRRALSPQSRNRIAFEMRREVKRARKQRRRDARRAGRGAGAGSARPEAAA